MIKMLRSQDLMWFFCHDPDIKRKDINDYEKILESKNFIDINFNINKRIDVINLCIKKLDAKSYLEIGCDHDEVFSKVSLDKKVGVDPFNGGNVRKTSNEFFETNNDKFDLIFIDGLHTYDQVRQDVLNSLKYLNQNGIIVIHDLLPITEKQTSEILPNPWFPGWLGSCYKLNFELNSVNNFDFHIVTTDLGCGVITNVKGNKINLPNFKTDWNFYITNYKKLPLVSFEKFKDLLND